MLTKRFFSKLYELHPFSLEFVPKHQPSTDRLIRGLQNFVDEHKHLLVLTGAGISTESGIPDYRSEDVGRFARTNHKPMSIQEFLKSEENRRRYWARNYAGWPIFSSFQFNVNHKILADWEKIGKAMWLVTQNVDSLHSKAGSQNLTELHGSAFRVKCLSCQRTIAREELQDHIKHLNPNWTENGINIAPDGDVDISSDKIAAFNTPNCDSCGGLLKPDIVFFGDNVPKQKVNLVTEKVANCDALLILGSSLQTFSAFRFIIQAIEFRKPIAIINIGHTRGDEFADVKISCRCGDILPYLEVHLLFVQRDMVPYSFYKNCQKTC